MYDEKPKIIPLKKATLLFFIKKETKRKLAQAARVKFKRIKRN
jgi:hypothetical protein